MIKRFNILFSLAICLISYSNVNAQDKLLFLNGKELEGSIIAKTNYEFTFKDEKEKEFVIDKYRVFSFTENNKQHIVYEFDTVAGNFLAVKDMKLFVYGERDAYKTFKPHVTNALGFAVGGTAGYFMHKDDAFLYITVPLIYTIGTLIFPTKVNQRRLKDTKYLNEDEYLRGYERIARSRRTQGALKSSLVGLGVGFLVSFLVNTSDKE